tara:strand:+ start:777 stop:1163 length:387 start_codon:yes stop_codon:yes gene_type:complete
MIRVAHRGNTRGKNPSDENSPKYVKETLAKGFHVEVDVWLFNKEWFLGHDDPRYPIAEEFLENDKLVCHAKNEDALHRMLKNKNIHCFWHENDFLTITSKGWVWKYPEIYYEGELIAICSDVASNRFL